ncbi:MAG TPA: DUF4412 domain-containing protein [Candidatus Goldiibacteriota bacterium]|nr:DUF4412 domain-containing protein [Candidatus Goldiibacteriota bacterium]HRQ44299.1 DUF4412 domain-containing protein [Candidatus Goldiibacteriota bacterium]
MKRILSAVIFVSLLAAASFAADVFEYIPYKSASWELKTVVEGEYPMSMDQKITYKNKKMRIDGAYKNPDTGKNENQVIIVKEDATYMYTPASKSGFKYSNNSVSNPQKMSNMASEYRDKAKKTGSETINGIACTVWEYTAGEDDAMKVKEWRGADGFIYRTVSETLKGPKSKYKSDILSLKKNIKADDSLFVIPADIKIMDMDNLLKGMQPAVKKSEVKANEKQNSKEVDEDDTDNDEDEGEDAGKKMQEKAAQEAADMLKGMFGQ